MRLYNYTESLPGGGVPTPDSCGDTWFIFFDFVVWALIFLTMKQWSGVNKHVLSRQNLFKNKEAFQHFHYQLSQ